MELGQIRRNRGERERGSADLEGEGGGGGFRRGDVFLDDDKMLSFCH